MFVKVKFGDNQDLYVNPDCGVRAIMEHIRKSLNLRNDDHVELCDSEGRLLNLEQISPMTKLNAFIKVVPEGNLFIPVRIERGEDNRILKLEPLLNEADKVLPEIIEKMNKHNNIRRQPLAHAQQQQQRPAKLQNEKVLKHGGRGGDKDGHVPQAPPTANPLYQDYSTMQQQTDRSGGASRSPTGGGTTYSTPAAGAKNASKQQHHGGSGSNKGGAATATPNTAASVQSGKKQKATPQQQKQQH